MDQMMNSDCFKRERSRSSGMSATKRNSAVEAEIILQNLLIDDLTKFGAGNTARRRSD